jgi:glycosyltransferase involved in cell wall biosynthesis
MAGSPKISVITVTNRIGWLPVLSDDMRRQTFRDFEVVVAADGPRYESHPYDGWTVFVPRQKSGADAWNLNKAYNDCLDRAQGELLVFLQDFIWIPANGLQRFWDDYLMFPDALVTGVGHKAKDGLEGISETDERALGDGEISPGNHTHWELNWAMCPRAMMPRFDESMDTHYGGENQHAARQAEARGARILIDRGNRCIGYSQDSCGGRPPDWEERHFNKTAGLTGHTGDAQ